MKYGLEYHRWMGLALVAMVTVASAVEPLSHGVTVDGDSVTVPAGRWRVLGTEVEIKAGVRFFVRGAGYGIIIDEPLCLAWVRPSGFWTGTKLQGPRAHGAINALGSLCADTLELRRERDGDVLVRNRDYLVSPEFALLGLGPDTRLTTGDVVYASYRYAVHRLDSVVLTAQGTVAYVQGLPQVAAMNPPAISPSDIRLFNVYRPYGARLLTKEHLFFFETEEDQIVTATTPGCIPKTLRKLKAGEPVTIVCWGDSVTVGADIADPKNSYVGQFYAALKDWFPASTIQLHNISIGGTRSIQWMQNGETNRFSKTDPSVCTFARILEAHPDLVTLEFVNDTTLNRDEMERVYTRVADELLAMGTEMILITPHFTHWRVMNVADGELRPQDTRPYVAFLREFSSRRNLGLADAAARWEQSWKQGIPFITLLANYYNHPSASGGRYFALELMKCFD